MARIPSIPILGQGAPQNQEPATQDLPPLPELSQFVIPQEPPMVTESERRIEEERSTSGVGDFLSTLGQTFTNVLPGSILQGGMSILKPGPSLGEQAEEMRADWLLDQASKAESQGRFQDAARMRIESDRLKGKLGASGALRSAVDELTFGSGSALTGESGMFGQPLPLTREEFGQTLYDPEGWGTFLGGLTGSVAMSGLMAVQPQLAPAVLASFGAMGYAGARQSYIDAMAEAGVEPDLVIADTVGLAGGLIELVSEQIGLDRISDAARKKIISELAEAAVSGEIRKASKTAARVIAQSIPGAAIESIEEAVAQVGQNISVLVGDITTTGVVPSVDQALARITSGIGESMLGGAIAGGATVTGIGAAQIPQMERDVYRRAAKMRIERDNLGDFKSISTVDDDAIADAALGGIQFDLTVGGEALTRKDAVDEAGRRGLLLSQDDLLTRESLEKAVEDPRKAAMARAAQARLFALSQAGMPEESMSFSRSDIRSMTGQSNAGEFNSRAARRRLASDLFGRVDGETYSPPVEIPEPRIAPTMEARAAEPETEDERLVARFQNNVRRQGIRSNLRAVVQEDLTEADRQVEADAAKRGLRVVWFEGTSSARIGGAAGDEKGVVYLRKTGRGSFDRGALRDAYLGILTHEASHDAELSEQGAKDVASLLDAAIPNYRGMDLQDKIEWAAARGYDPDLLNESNIDSEIAAILQENTETLRSSGALSALVADRNRFGRALDWVRRGLTKLGFNGQEAKAVLRHLEKSATRPDDAIAEAMGVAQEATRDSGGAEDRAIEARLSAGKKKKLGFRTYYSQLERVIAESKQRRMTADQFKSLMSKNGVGNEEMYWSGIVDWMKGKDSIDLDEAARVARPVMNNIGIGTYRIKDVEKSMLDFDRMIDRRIAELDEDEYKDIASSRYDGEDEAGRRDAVRKFIRELIEDEIREDDYAYRPGIGDTKFSPITYPELVLQGPMLTYAETLANFDDPDTSSDDPFYGNHWTLENIFVHGRWTVRPFVSTGDSSSNWSGLTLFVEEIQSDWHQSGKDVGYGETKRVIVLPSGGPRDSGGNLIRAKNRVRSLVDRIYRKTKDIPLDFSVEQSGNEYAPYIARADITPLIDRSIDALGVDPSDPHVSRIIKRETQSFRDGLNTEGGIAPKERDIRDLISIRMVNALSRDLMGPPEAPFKSTQSWAGFMLKHLVAISAWHKPLENDRVRGRISRITIADASEQRRRSRKSGEEFTVQYDKILPRELERIAKKFGAKLDRVSIPMNDGSTRQFVSMEINDEIRKQIRRIGFPLFSSGRSMDRQTFNSAIVSKFSESYDQTGIVDETTGFLLDDGTPVTMGMDGIRGEDHRGIVGGKSELKKLGVSPKSIKDAEQGTRTPAMFELMRIGSLLRTFIHRAGGGGVALGVSLAPGQTVTPDQRRALRDFVIERRPTLLTVDTFRDDGSSVSREIDDPVADDVGDLLRFSASRRVNAMLSRHRGQFVDLKLPIGSPLAYARMAQRIGITVSVKDLSSAGVTVHMVDGFDSGYAYSTSESGAVTVNSMVVADISQPLVVESMVLHAVSRNPQAPALVVGAIDDYNLQAALVAMGADLTFDQDEGIFRADIGSIYPAEVRAGIAERGLDAWQSYVRGLRGAEPEGAAGVRPARGRADSRMPRLEGAAAVEGAGAEVAPDGGRGAGVVAGRRGFAAEVSEAIIPKRMTPAETAQRLNRRQFIIPEGSYEHDLIDRFLTARSDHSVAETEVRSRTKNLDKPFKETTGPERRKALMNDRNAKLENAKKAAARARADVIEVGNALRFAQEHRFSMLGIPWMAPASKGVDNKIPIGDLMPGVEVSDVQTIASALNRWALDIIGYNSRNVASAQAHVIMAMTDELVEAARRGGTAADWYISLIEETKSVWRMAYPKELGADTNEARRNMDVLLVIMAITSNGERVDANVAHTRKVFDHYLKTGKIEVPASRKSKDGEDDESGLQRAAAVKKTFAFFNAMSAFYDHERVMELLKIRGTERKQMLDLTAMIRKDLNLTPKDLSFSSDIPDGEQMQLSQLFGPKIGAFWANLNGNFDILTADLWFTRTFAYYMANLTTPESRVIKARIEELGQIAAGKITSKRLLESGKKKGMAVSEAEILEAARLLGFDPSMMGNPAALGAWIESVVPKWQKAKNYTVDVFPAIKSQSASMKEAARGVLHGIKAIYEGDPRISEAPEGAKERGLMASYMVKAIKVAEKNGYPMPVSSAQALLWYWEKDVYYAFNAGERGEGQDFANASRKVLADRLSGKSRTRLSAGTSGPVFRNVLVDHLSTMQDKATPQQVLAHIGKNSRAAAHADWADIRSFLDGKDKVTKVQLVEWASANDIVVGERMLTQFGYEDNSRLDPLSSAYGTYVDHFRSASQDLKRILHIGTVELTDDQGDALQYAIVLAIRERFNARQEEGIEFSDRQRSMGDNFTDVVVSASLVKAEQARITQGGNVVGEMASFSFSTQLVSGDERPDQQKIVGDVMKIVRAAFNANVTNPRELKDAYNRLISSDAPEFLSSSFPLVTNWSGEEMNVDPDDLHQFVFGSSGFGYIGISKDNASVGELMWEDSLAEAMVSAQADDYVDPNAGTDETKWSRYTVFPSEGQGPRRMYGEILVTIPSRARLYGSVYDSVSNSPKPDVESSGGIAAEEAAIGMFHDAFVEALDSASPSMLDLYAAGTYDAFKKYEHMHWRGVRLGPDDFVMAHGRYQVINAPDGPILHVEEIQSDYWQSLDDGNAVSTSDAVYYDVRDDGSIVNRDGSPSGFEVKLETAMGWSPGQGEYPIARPVAVLFMPIQSFWPNMPAENVAIENDLRSVSGTQEGSNRRRVAVIYRRNNGSHYYTLSAKDYIVTGSVSPTAGTVGHLNTGDNAHLITRNETSRATGVDTRIAFQKNGGIGSDNVSREIRHTLRSAEAAARISFVHEVMQANRGIGETRIKAPFQKRWPQLVAERAIQIAAQMGIDRVSISSSDIQVARWGTDRVEWEKVEPGDFTYEVIGIAAELEQLGFNIDDPSNSTLIKIDAASVASQLEERDNPSFILNVVDPSVASGAGIYPGIWVVSIGTRRLQGGPIVSNVNFNGGDVIESAIGDLLTDRDVDRGVARRIVRMLREGNFTAEIEPRAEGMQQFYDRKLISDLSKFVKRYGATVSSGTIQGSTMEGYAARTFPTNIVNITPELKAAVLGGITKFSAGRMGMDWNSDAQMFKSHDVLANARAMGGLVAAYGDMDQDALVGPAEMFVSGESTFERYEADVFKAVREAFGSNPNAFERKVISQATRSATAPAKALDAIRNGAKFSAGKRNMPGEWWFTEDGIIDAGTDWMVDHEEISARRAWSDVSDMLSRVGHPSAASWESLTEGEFSPPSFGNNPEEYGPILSRISADTETPLSSMLLWERFVTELHGMMEAASGRFEGRTYSRDEVRMAVLSAIRETDPREYGMEIGWIRVGESNTIQLKTLTKSALSRIADGVYEVMDELAHEQVFDIEVADQRRVFERVPFSVIEQASVVGLAPYRGARYSASQRPVNPATGRGYSTRDKDYPVERGMEAVIRRISLEMNRGDLSVDDGVSMMAIARMVGYTAMHDVGIRFVKPAKGDGGWLGSYDIMRTLVMINRDAMVSGEVTKTFVHEMWHSVTRMLEPEFVEAIRKDYLRDVSEFIERYGFNPRGATIDPGVGLLAQSMGIDLTDPRYYRLITIDEYIAVTMADLTMERLANLSPKSKSVIDYMRELFGSMIDWIRGFFAGRPDLVYDQLVDRFLANGFPVYRFNPDLAEHAAFSEAVRGNRTLKPWWLDPTIKPAQRLSVVNGPMESAFDLLKDKASRLSAGLPPIKRSEMTTAMRAWSKESKVVDADGNLMPVYHGTSSRYDFSEFSTTDKNGYPVGAYRGGILAFFSTDPKFASDYAGEDGQVIPSVLNIVKPFDFREEETVESVLESFGRSTDDGETFLVDMNWQQFKKAVRRGEYDALENEDFVMFLRGLGYDGIVTKELGSINYAIFEPNQVKGYFNATPTEDPRFMYSAGLRFRETRTNIIRTRGQDAYIMLEKALEDFEAAHGALPPSKNPLLAIRRMPGAIGVKQSRFRENRVNPLLRRMAESRISMRYMGEYLFALHAVERNAYVRQINPGADELGSGMTDKRANDIIGAVNARSDSAVWQSIAAEWQAIARESLDTQLAAGLITKADYDNITARYKNYVPMIDAPEGSGPPLEQEVKRFSLGKRQLRQTTGRGESAATEEEFTGVIVHIVGQRETVMSRAYRNIVANRFLQLARYREEPGLWRIIPEPTRRQVNLNTGVVEEVPDNSWRNDPTIMEVLVIKPFVRQETETVDGVLTTVEREYGKGSRVLVKIESEELGKNLTRGNIPGEHWAMTALRVAKAWTNYVRLFATSAFNPDFLLSNPSRDVQGAIASVVTEEAKAKEVMKDFARGYPAAFKAVFSALHGKEIRDQELADHWRRFEDLGGRQTLFVPQDFDERYKELVSEMSDPTRMQVAGGLAKKAIVDIWDNLNGVMDNSIRFSYYVAAVRAGVDPEIAAVKARNLTVDFSKRGSQSAQVMQMYAFANAGIQGTTKFARLTKSRRGRVIIGSLFVTGFLNAMLQDLLSDDDDDRNGIADAKQVPEWKHDTNIVIPTGLGVSAKIPLNYGLNVPYVLGRKFWQTLSGSKPMTTAAGEAAASMLATFNPFGGEGLMDSGHGFVRALAPDILDIPVDVMLGKDYRGNDLYKVSPFEKDPVLSETGSTRVPDSIKAFSRILNASTGGDYATSGFIDLPPDAVWYVMMQLTGGTGRSLERVGKTVSNLIEGSVEVSEIPGIRRFVEEYPTPESNTSIYYEIRDQVSEVDARIGRYETEREKYGAIRESGLTESAIDAIKNADKEIRAIRKEIRELEQSGRNPRTVEILNKRLDRIRADAILRFTKSTRANR
jgi:hypothetical protein